MSEVGGDLGMGSRFTEGPSPELVQSAFALEAGDGVLLYHGMSLADMAHAIMLIETGIIPADVGAQLLAALLDMHQIAAVDFPFDPARGDPFSNREHILRQKAPIVAGWLQAGRPRREVSTIAYLLLLRDRLLALSS